MGDQGTVVAQAGVENLDAQLAPRSDRRNTLFLDIFKHVFSLKRRNRVFFSCYDGGRWTPAFGNGYERENRIETNLSDLRRQLAPLQAGE